MGTLKNFWENNKSKVAPLLCILVIVVGALLTVKHFSNEGDKSVKAIADGIEPIKLPEKPLIKYVDTDGKYRVKVEEQNITIAQLSSAIAAKDSAVIKMSRELKDWKDKATNLTVVSNIIHDTIEVPVYISIDSTLTFNYADRWATINGSIKNNVAKIDYSVRDSIYFIRHEENYGFLGLKSRDMLNVYNANDKTINTGLQSYNINRPKKFYEKKGFIFLGGILVGIVVHKTVR